MTRARPTKALEHRARLRGGARVSKLATGLVVALGFGACGEPVPICLSSLPTEPGDKHLVRAAAAILNVEVEFTERVRGTIHLTLAELDAGRGGGVTSVNTRCVKAVTANREVRTVAHEFGHALGLQHTCEAPCPESEFENLMNGEWGVGAGVELSEEQLDNIDRGRRRLTRCR